MDRMNFNSYDHFHYYNQTYQESGQPTFQPETGQTSGGGATSGASWNYPGQPYQDFNVQAQIPFSPGPDWESFLRTPEPMAMEDIIHGQIHQQDGQYSSHETGQTSAGGAASGPWWSQPPGQLQPHQGFNVPAQIPPSLGSDVENLQPPFQSMVLEDSVQNDASLAPSNPQPAAARRRRKPQTSTKARFLAGLKAFELGVDLKDCSSTLRFNDYIKSNGTMNNRGKALYNQFTDEEKTLLREAIIARQEAIRDPVEVRFLASLDNYAGGMKLIECSEDIAIRSYVTEDGNLREEGEALCARLPPADWKRVKQALLSRRQFYSNQLKERALRDCLPQESQERVVNEALQYHVNRATALPPPEERFLAGLANYVQGAQLDKCSATIRFGDHVTVDGKLQERGQELLDRMSLQDQNRVKQALATRRRLVAEQLSEDFPNFMAALGPYSNGVDFQTCAKQSGLNRLAESYLTPEGGLTAKGELLIENLPPDEQVDVRVLVGLRAQRLNPSAQVPGSPWQLPEIPASMPEMRGMDPASMVDPMQTETMLDPMQTEAMWAAVWQLTGQAAPGTWGIPSESAEPSMPSYDNEAFGGDYQHYYGAYADQYPGRGV
ncbi:MAG: hypothetical protein P8X89_22975 [Reinekea sp.]